VEDSVGLLTISPVYLPPRYTVEQEQFEDFYNTLGQRFIAGGTTMQSIPTRDPDLYHSKTRTTRNDGKPNFKYLPTGEPTYWPSDRNKLLDLVDFCVTGGIPQHFAVSKSCFDVSSDHFLILITLTADALNHENEPILSKRHTNWEGFRRLVNERLSLNIFLKTEDDIEVAAKFFNDAIQLAVWNASQNIKGHSRHTTAL
jgi:hypothetical protein